MEVSILEWFLGLPANAAIGIAVGYVIVMGIKWGLDYLMAKAGDDPDAAFRDDLMQAHKELRAEVQELRKELGEAYDKIRTMTIELNAIREGIMSMKLEIYAMKAEHPNSQEVLHRVIERLESVSNGESPSNK